MKTELTLDGALANCSSECKSEDLLQFLKERTEDVDYYRLTPKPGVVMMAAFDWQAVLSVTSSVITIAGAIWTAYRHFIVPQKEKGNDSAFLIVSVQNEKRERIQFTLGNEYKDKETFIREFTETVEKTRITDGVRTIETENRETRSLETWTKVK